MILRRALVVAFVAIGCSGSSYAPDLGDPTAAPEGPAPAGPTADPPPPADAKDSGPSADAAPAHDAAPEDAGTQEASAGTSCATYCALMRASCTNANAMYADDGECAKVCAYLPPGSSSDTTNTLGCRVYHLSLVTGGGPASVHCPHAGPFGGDACGAHCGDFCQLAANVCPGAFSDPAACAAACAAWPRASPQVHATGPASGDTFDCRAYYLGEAVTAPATHCGQITQASAPCR